MHPICLVVFHCVRPPPLLINLYHRQGASVHCAKIDAQCLFYYHQQSLGPTRHSFIFNNISHCRAVYHVPVEGHNGGSVTSEVGYNNSFAYAGANHFFSVSRGGYENLMVITPVCRLVLLSLDRKRARLNNLRLYNTKSSTWILLQVIKPELSVRVKWII